MMVIFWIALWLLMLPFILLALLLFPPLPRASL
jgi:hypothetical protein